MVGCTCLKDTHIDTHAQTRVDIYKRRPKVLYLTSPHLLLLCCTTSFFSCTMSHLLSLSSTLCFFFTLLCMAMDYTVWDIEDMVGGGEIGRVEVKGRRFWTLGWEQAWHHWNPSQGIMLPVRWVNYYIAQQLLFHAYLGSVVHVEVNLLYISLF